MYRIRIISGIFEKQAKDLFKNLQVLMLFFVYPIVAVIMSSTLSGTIEFTSRTFFIATFATMHSIFSPIVATVSIIAEEKEKGTLRALIMSNVKPVDYMISVGGFVFICTMLSGLIFLLADAFTLEAILKLLLSMSIGTICSIILGLSIGAYSKNMAAANALSVPIGMIFAFLPMLASFNEKIANFSKFTYGYQISKLISSDSINIAFGDWMAILTNLILFIIMFIIVFRRNKLED
jgi:ABC-2 type transport system permease protein